jgi:hypothetical protein
MSEENNREESGTVDPAQKVAESPTEDKPAASTEALPVV